MILPTPPMPTMGITLVLSKYDQGAMQFLNSQAASDVVFVICLSSQQKPFDFPQSSSYIWPSVKPAQCAGSFYILLIFASKITLVLILSLHTFKPIQFCIFKHTHTHTHLLNLYLNYGLRSTLCNGMLYDFGFQESALY